MRDKLFIECLNLFCLLFTVGVIFSRFWFGQPHLEMSTIIAGSFVVGRILRFAFTGKAILPAESANG